MRTLGLLGTAFVSALACAGPTLAFSKSPILFDGGLRCPAIKTGVGSCANAKYNTRIYLIPKIDGPAKALTNGATNDTHPVWSPDRARIAFYRSHTPIGGPTASHPATPDTALWIMKADGTGAHRVAVGVTIAGNGGPTWSPDGTKIAFTGLSPNGKTTDIYGIRANGLDPIANLTNNPDKTRADYPAWSSTGQIVFSHHVSPGFPETWEMNADGSGAKSLFRGGIQYAWTPNAAKLAYVANDNRGRLEIFVTKADGTGSTQITTASSFSMPSWAPNGKQLVLVRANQITMINADGSGTKQLTKKNPLSFVENPAW